MRKAWHAPRPNATRRREPRAWRPMSRRRHRLLLNSTGLNAASGHRLDGAGKVRRREVMLPAGVEGLDGAREKKKRSGLAWQGVVSEHGQEDTERGIVGD